MAFALLAAVGSIASCSDSPESTQDPSEFCAFLVSAADPFSVDDDSLESVTDDLRRLRAVAPAEITPALDTLLAAFETVSGEADPDDAAELLAAEQAELLAASDELAAYSLATCGIDLNR